MREDDLLRVVMHDAWAACYARASEDSAAKTQVSFPDLAPEEAWRLLQPQQEPGRFSSTVQEELDEAVEFFTVGVWPAQARALRLASVARRASFLNSLHALDGSQKTREIESPEGEWLRAVAAVALIFGGLVLALYCTEQWWKKQDSSSVPKIRRRGGAPSVQLSAAKRL